jgi:RNA polymerase sigma factor (sigma-70 family)
MTQSESQRRRRFDALFASYSSDIVAYCGWRAGSASDAQDAVADVFLTAWRRLDQLPEGDAARVWLYATARRVIANQRRSNRRRVALQERLALEAASVPQEPFPPNREETLVREALRRLGPRDREVLLLAEWEGLSPAQIAGVLGCLTVTARGRLHRARSRFRAVYEELLARDDSGQVRREGSEVSTTQVFRRRVHEHV